MARVFLTAPDLKALSEFPVIENAQTVKLQVFVDRAHAMIRGMGTLPRDEDLESDEEREDFRKDMRLAHFLLAERVVLANPATPSAASGVTFEKIGRYEYSRARTTDRSGDTIDTELLTREIVNLLAYWLDDDEEEFKVTRTDVFGPANYVDANDPNRRVIVEEDFTEMTRPATGRQRIQG